MFRVGKDRENDALKRPGASPVVFDGRRFSGTVWVKPARCDARALKRWIALAREFVAELPPKR